MVFSDDLQLQFVFEQLEQLLGDSPDAAVEVVDDEVVVLARQLRKARRHAEVVLVLEPVGKVDEDWRHSLVVVADKGDSLTFSQEIGEAGIKVVLQKVIVDVLDYTGHDLIDVRDFLQVLNRSYFEKCPHLLVVGVQDLASFLDDARHQNEALVVDESPVPHDVWLYLPLGHNKVHHPAEHVFGWNQIVEQRNLEQNVHPQQYEILVV